MIIEKFFNFISKFHHYKIASYVKNLDCKILIDVGSHKGEFLKSFLDINKIRKFYCFEPQIEVFKFLKKEFKNNKKVKLHNFALGECQGKKKIYISNLTSLSTMSKFDDKSFWLKFKNLIVGDKRRSNSVSRIKQKKIDMIFKNISLKKSFLKIDVEGYELNVLKGCEKKIKEIPYVLVENHTFSQYHNKFNLVNEFLNNNNFVIVKRFYYPTFHYKDVLYKKKGQ